MPHRARNVDRRSPRHIRVVRRYTAHRPPGPRRDRSRPAAPRAPTYGRPSRMSAPPTPVPSQRPRTLRAPHVAPSSHSPSRPTFASLPNATGTPSRSPRSLTTSTCSCQFPRLGTVRTRPSWTTPGIPTPAAMGSPSMALIRSAIAERTASGPSVGVGAFMRACTLCWSSTRPTSMFVPPTSTPATSRPDSAKVLTFWRTQTRTRPCIETDRQNMIGLATAIGLDHASTALLIVSTFCSSLVRKRIGRAPLA